MSETPASDAGSPAPRRRGWLRVAAAAGALVLTALVVYVGVQVAAPDQTSRPPTATPRPSPTPLDSVDVSRLPVARRPLCTRIEDRDVQAALEGPVESTDHYGSGQRVTIAPGLRDVSHEFNCTYRGAAGATARVWLFAEPVTPKVARGIVRDARTAPSCRRTAGGPTFGTPSVTTVCTPAKGKRSTVALRGLFGDAWLSCQLTPVAGGTLADTVHRTEQWCVRVVTRVGARP